MPGTVDDFIQRFGGNQTMDDREASQYYDRFVSTDERDRDFDNNSLYQGASQYLGQLPDDQFEQAAQNAYSHAGHQQRQGFVDGLWKALLNNGVDPSSIGNRIGVNASSPYDMRPDDYARLANYARREHPQAMQQAVREQPGILKALGNPFVMGALAFAASRLMKNRQPGPGMNQPGGLEGLFRR
jgi:hypothetical protein